ncbi:DUF1972 domain-containing protein [Piscinibacter sakaiensis]|nr:DUF1972 domain-containing protein [Piscinibacter sakaiensis]
MGSDTAAMADRARAQPDPGRHAEAALRLHRSPPLHAAPPSSASSFVPAAAPGPAAADDGAPAPSLSIMGIRGLPARHGGFETFAARLAPFLVQRGWRVTVYCQEETPPPAPESELDGVRLVHLHVGADTAWNSIRFDHACIAHALRERPPLVLTLGYNTALLALRLRRAGIVHTINMDGIEWARAKWGPLARAWLYLNEWAGALGAHHLFADHPEISVHLQRRVPERKITTIPYGTDLIQQADASLLAPFGLEPGRYCTLIARPEPENSLLEIVEAFSARRRGVKLIVLGNLRPERVRYHARVQAAASDEVIFAGAIFDAAIVRALRLYGLVYLHGHQVGGTNPSLLEAMGAGNPVIAHDNRFNRWVAGGSALFFDDAASCAQALDTVLAQPGLRLRLAEAATRRATTAFRWDRVLQRYETTLAALQHPVDGQHRPPPASSYDPSNFMDYGR